MVDLLTQHNNFTNHPQIINGASNLLVKIFGEKENILDLQLVQIHLPMNISVEIEAIVYKTTLDFIWSVKLTSFPS